MTQANPTSLDTSDVLAVDAAVARSTGVGNYGITDEGFVPKPFTRLLAEKLALARALLGEDLDLTSGSVLRKIFEVSALEDARTWAALAGTYENLFITSATGDALSRLGDEQGMPRPFLEATGMVRLSLVGDLPPGINSVSIPRGTRMLTAGGHHVATAEPAALTSTDRTRDVAVVAFYPGPSHNLDPKSAEPDGSTTQQIVDWNYDDERIPELIAGVGSPVTVKIDHKQPLTGGERRWPDARYRRLLLRAPRSIWTTEAVQVAVSLVPGVRQAQVHDTWGGLDLKQSIFGNFDFIDRVFNTERDLGSPYYFTVLVAPTPSAIWDGPDGLRAAVLSAVEDVRPIGIFPDVQEAQEVYVGVSAELVVKGIPLPSGTRSAVNESQPAKALKNRLQERIAAYVDALTLGEPVRAAEITWVLMNEPGVVDVRNLALLQFPPRTPSVDFATAVSAKPARIAQGGNVEIATNQIAVFVDNASELQIA